MIDFAPGMRAIIRDEEWMVKKTETNSLGNKALYCIGISPLVKDREVIFFADLEQIQIVDPAEVKLIADNSPFVILEQVLWTNGVKRMVGLNVIRSRC